MNLIQTLEAERDDLPDVPAAAVAGSGGDRGDAAFRFGQQFGNVLSGGAALFGNVRRRRRQLPQQRALPDDPSDSRRSR